MTAVARTIAGGITAGALLLVLLGASRSGPPACVSEDSVGCYWDASTRGNGLGRSFWVSVDGVVTYVGGSR